jgi:hypothetical protein
MMAPLSAGMIRLHTLPILEADELFGRVDPQQLLETVSQASRKANPRLSSRAPCVLTHGKASPTEGGLYR